MRSSDHTWTFRGSCHCGQLDVAFSTASAPASINPRACDCSFCQKHAAAYISDSKGQLTVTVHNAEGLRRCRQGSNAAQFLLCDRCGVLAAVIFEHEAHIYGAVNAGVLQQPTGFGRTVPVSPQWLAPEEKITRWRQVWVPNVALVIATDTPTA